MEGKSTRSSPSSLWGGDRESGAIFVLNMCFGLNQERLRILIGVNTERESCW